MDIVKMFYLIMFIFVIALTAWDFIGEEKTKKLEPS